jgi:hypothetical protein
MSETMCPCKDCICVPKCRHKEFIKLFNDCLLLRIYEPNYPVIVEREKDRIYKIRDILKPTEWDFTRVRTKSSSNEEELDDIPYVCIKAWVTGENKRIKPIRGRENQ